MWCHCSHRHSIGISSCDAHSMAQVVESTNSRVGGWKLGHSDTELKGASNGRETHCKRYCKTSSGKNCQLDNFLFFKKNYSLLMNLMCKYVIWSLLPLNFLKLIKNDILYIPSTVHNGCIFPNGFFVVTKLALRKGTLSRIVIEMISLVATWTVITMSCTADWSD